MDKTRSSVEVDLATGAETSTNKLKFSSVTEPLTSDVAKAS